MSQFTSWPSVKKQNGSETTPMASSATCGKCLVGWTFEKTWKNSPLRAAANGTRE